MTDLRHHHPVKHASVLALAALVFVVSGCVTGGQSGQSSTPKLNDWLDASVEALVGTRASSGRAAELSVFNGSVVLVDGFGTKASVKTVTVTMAPTGKRLQTWTLTDTPLVDIEARQFRDELVIVGADCPAQSSNRSTESVGDDPDCGSTTYRIVALHPRTGRWRTIAKAIPVEPGLAVFSDEGAYVYVSRASKLIALADGSVREGDPFPDDVRLCDTKRRPIGIRIDETTAAGPDQARRSITGFAIDGRRVGRATIAPDGADPGALETLTNANAVGFAGCQDNSMALWSTNGRTTTVTRLWEGLGGVIMARGSSAVTTGAPGGAVIGPMGDKAVIVTPPPTSTDIPVHVAAVGYQIWWKRVPVDTAPVYPHALLPLDDQLAAVTASGRDLTVQTFPLR